jgi:hypothetical protein
MDGNDQDNKKDEKTFDSFADMLEEHAKHEGPEQVIEQVAHILGMEDNHPSGSSEEEDKCT